MDAETFLPANTGANYREFFAMLCKTLPPSPGDSPDARAARERSAMDAVVALHPDDAFEARLAVRIVAMDAQCAASLHAAGLAVDDPMELRRCRAQAASMARQSDAALRSLLRIQATRDKQLEKAAPRSDGTRRLVVPRGSGARPRARGSTGAGRGAGALAGGARTHSGAARCRGRAVCRDVSGPGRAHPRRRRPAARPRLWPAGAAHRRRAAAQVCLRARDTAHEMQH